MSDVKMINLTIEGRMATVPEGTSILEAAKQVGVLIPHYCYHPGLPVAGVCRMCLVEVEKAPKLAPACATAALEGQVVLVHSEKALEARKGVLEFLLINHPLDCPICDQSGECELQDYTFQEGRKDSRYDEPKRFNPVEDFGGDVVYVANRCILCTRCVRFMEDVADDPVLNVSERGDRAVIGKFEGNDLTHAWAGNVIELCPVGALLSKDSLNKVRAWEVDRAASVCGGCSQGCNTIVETRDNVVVRLRPRTNTEVNQYFMCDHGRLGYRGLNGRNRIEAPMVASPDGMAPVDWDFALDAAADRIRGGNVVVIASPRLPNEALFLLSKILRQTGGKGVFEMETGDEAALAGVKDLALRSDRAPNGTGAELMGFERVSNAVASIAPGSLVVLAGHEISDSDADALRAAADVILIGSELPPAAVNASVMLPINNHSEEDGSFTNLRGRVQRFQQAKAGPGFSRPSWYVLTDLASRLGEPTDYMLPSEVFDALARDNPEFAGLSYDTLGLRGALVAGANSLAGADK